MGPRRPMEHEMSNTLITPTELTRTSLAILHQKVKFIGSINRQYDDRFAKSGAKIGSQLQIRLPNEFQVRTGAVMDAQAITENYLTLSVATQKGVDFSFSSADLTMSIDRFSERYLEPAMAKLAATMESDALSMYKDVNWEMSDDGDTISVADVLEGGKMLTDNLCPTDGRTLLLNTRDNVSLVNANTGLFNPNGRLSRQYETGKVQDQFMGYSDIMESSLMPTHTTGTETANTWRTDIAAGEANGSATYPEAGGSIHIDTGSTSFKRGDIIEIAGVNAVHRESKVSLGRRMRFVVTADFAGSAEGDLAIYPAIVASGAKQNVDAAPADSVVVYKIESDGSTALAASADYGISLGYHRDAFTFVTADLELPKGTDMAAREVYDGISLRFIRDYQIGNDVFGCRFDVYYGYKCIRPEFAVRYGH